MSAIELAQALKARLAAELREDLASVERRGASVQTLARSADDEDGATAHMRTLALAYELERYYTAVESLISRAVLALDGSLPSGDRRHSELLRAASVPVPGMRPALISAPSVPPLRELLSFRHFARHAYDVEPDITRLTALAQHTTCITPDLQLTFAELFVALTPAPPPPAAR